MRTITGPALLIGLAALACRTSFAAAPAVIETPEFEFKLSPENGHYELVDKRANVTWQSNPREPRFGEVRLNAGGRQTRVSLARCEVSRNGGGLDAVFHPLADQPAAAVRISVRPKTAGVLDVSWQADLALGVESIRLLDEALGTEREAGGSLVVPVREGLLIPADSGRAFTHRFGTYEYEGCHMAMFGTLRSGAAALVTWDDPYVTLEVQSIVTNTPWAKGGPSLLPSLVLRRSAHSFQIHLLGKGDHVTVGRAYRQVAQEKGWLVTWDQKLRGHPERAKYFGASNFKLWSTLSREMNDESTRELSVRVNWTFGEAGQIAAHLKNDLQLERVLFIMGGWIHRGYDNQHPDILPTAPECGGDAAFAEACRRIRALGYLLCLHDNYQDIYRDSPSWDESVVQKTADGKLTVGGKWAGGRAYITCSQKALDLARRPQNLVAVQRLSGADSCFIDTTYAAGLQECFDPQHPLTRRDDMKWKQALSDYAREVFGSFGSECGREWAIPHSDFFEGLTGVSGTSYHNKELPRQLGATVVPLFEIVYRDSIAVYGKYGYDVMKSAEYVLQHIALGRPLNYHSVPSHLYWKERPWDGRPLPLRPAVAEFKETGPRRFALTYRWTVGGPVGLDWPALVHFTDAGGKILFQGDYDPQPRVTEWKPGEVLQGPFEVRVPEGLEGVFDIRTGLFNRGASGSRPALEGEADEEHRYFLGRVSVQGNKVTFVAAPAGAAPQKKQDAGLFCRSDGGWAEGMHHMDRFVKNTHEILSPLNEITARLPMTRHEFLTADRRVQRTVFGEGPRAVTAVINLGPDDYRHHSALGGEVVLPALGFVVESPGFAAFHARNWAGVDYADPPLFTLRSLDGRPLGQSKQTRVFHAFGDPRVMVGGRTQSVPREATLKGE